MFNITIAYATPMQQLEIPLQVEPNCNVALAIRRSGILEKCPEIPFPEIAVGIFGKRVKLDAILHEGDRIEIYRPLLIDPKRARILRAKQAQR